MKTNDRIYIIASIIGVALLLYLLFYLLAPSPQKKPVERYRPKVLTQLVELKTVQVFIEADGTIVPALETILNAEVAGQIRFVSPKFRVGKYFKQGEILLEIEPAEYEVALAEAKRLLAQAKEALQKEKAESTIAKQEWEAYNDESAPDLVLRIPQLKAAKANLGAARKRVKKAKLDLSRTKLRTPYPGRVRAMEVELGQFVRRGDRLGSVFSSESAEARLSIAQADLPFLDLQTLDGGSLESYPVRIFPLASPAEQGRKAQLLRSEGELDPVTKVFRLVASIPDPFNRQNSAGLQPLLMGSFVDAKIPGRFYENIASVPRSAIYPDSKVLVVQEDNSIQLRSVEILKSQADRVLIKSGLKKGERICISKLDAVVDGMGVSLIESDKIEPSRGS